ncbi:DUF4038 domain-containing protein [Paenibacillus psychroresistens]|uniref:DUF4038 domain-containing protein n=1 Tax=Paenibacillus psychroresistens TaxID=1778678 RepID=A0A6B8RGD0_9BACL|nr:DUF4038 domain-containing protein [Paenibacillus psychroresistens]QGQ94997.1 DUF4038 domain-containing protein [Paenibacillus psychroresistens]
MDINGYLEIASNNRSFQTKAGIPVFWLGDTAWSCPGRASWEEWVEYVDTRASQGFNVIQMNSLPQHDAYQPIFQGRQPFSLQDAKSEDGRIFKWDYDHIHEDYFDFLERMIVYANNKGMLIALIVIWFEHVPHSRPTVIPPDHPGMTVKQGVHYGKYLVKKLKDLNVIWIISGDDDYKGDGVADFYNAVALAVKETDTYGRLITTHPVHKSGDTYHQASWLDFNMVQSGHGNNQDTAFLFVRDEWNRNPPKPVLNAEPCYEQHPLRDKEHPFDRYDVRRACWRSVMEGSITGVTYGADGIWHWARSGEVHLNRSAAEYISWQEALQLPGALDLVRMKQLLMKLPWYSLEPSSERLLSEQQSYISVAASKDGKLLLAYLPEKGPIRLDISSLDSSIRAIWWEPGSGDQVAAEAIMDNEFSSSSPFQQDALLIIYSEN